ncbi:MAG: helix-turn-helix domain-containing protein [Wenzhouxiangella sp.]
MAADYSLSDDRKNRDQRFQAHSLAQWQALVSERVHQMSAASVSSTPPTAFFSELSFGHFGPSTWLAVRGSAQQLRRSASDIGDGGGEWLFVSTMTQGSGWLVSDQLCQRVDAGETVFVDSARPYALVFDQDFAFVSAMLPRADLLLFHPHVSHAHACKVEAPVGAALHAFLRAMALDPPAASPPPAVSSRKLYDHFVGLMLAAIEPIALAAPQSQPSAAEVLTSRMQADLLAVLAQADLDSAWLANRFGVSVRKVQRLFRAQETTVARWLLEQRLLRCAESLADPAQAAIPIGDIAQGWGFMDLSYFSRAFARRYGLRPGQYRAGQLGLTAAAAKKKRGD